MKNCNGDKVTPRVLNPNSIASEFVQLVPIGSMVANIYQEINLFLNNSMNSIID